MDDICDIMETLCKCPICLGTLEDPRMIECGHTFCLVCIQRVYLEEPEGVNSALCPLCKARFFPKGRNAGTLARNYVARAGLGMLEKYSNEQHDEEQARDACDVCEDEDVALAVYYCVQCRRRMCQACTRKHRRIHSDHTLVNLEEIRDTHMYELLSSQIDDDNCRDHLGMKLIHYCVPCKKPLCENCCISNEHRRHVTKPIRSVTESENSKFRKVIAKIDVHVNDLETCHAYWTYVHEKLTTSHQATRVKATARAHELRAIIDQNEANTIDAIDSEFNKRNVKIVAQLNTLEASLSMRRSQLEKARSYYNIGSPCQKVTGMKVLNDDLAKKPMTNITWPPINCRDTINLLPFMCRDLTKRSTIGNVTTKRDMFILKSRLLFRKKTVEDVTRSSVDVSTVDVARPSNDVALSTVGVAAPSNDVAMSSEDVATSTV